MKIKIEVEVPEGEYCRGCFFISGFEYPTCDYYGKELEINFVLATFEHKKCPACLRACEAKEKE